MDLIATARGMAEKAHAGMVRPNSRRSPYSEHYEEVAALVAAHGGSAEEVAAALLHDAVEDTGMALDEIAARLNARVAELVDGMTDPPHFSRMPTAQRKAMQAERVRAKDDGVKRIKVADQTSNARACAVDPPVRWDDARCLAYVNGAKLIVDACRDACPEMAALFDEAHRACLERFDEAHRERPGRFGCGQAT